MRPNRAWPTQDHKGLKTEKILEKNTNKHPTTTTDTQQQKHDGGEHLKPHNPNQGQPNANLTTGPAKWDYTAKGAKIYNQIVWNSENEIMPILFGNTDKT